MGRPIPADFGEFPDGGIGPPATREPARTEPWTGILTVRRRVNLCVNRGLAFPQLKG